jgi:hypothetical protein
MAPTGSPPEQRAEVRTIETVWKPRSELEIRSSQKLVEDGMKAGFLPGVEGCLASALGARVRLSEGQLTVTDGPFTEAKEVIGRLAFLPANSKEGAIELVKQFLHAAGADGECELRQVRGAPEYAGSERREILDPSRD